MGERQDTRWRYVPVALVSAAVLICFLGWTTGLVLVAFDRVVPAWAMAGVLLVLAFVSLAVRRKRSAGPREGNRPLRFAAAFALVGVLLGVVGDLGARYFVYAPAGPDGCRVVARETAFLFAGSGEVYVAGWPGFAVEHGSYRTDDGYRPFTWGTFRFEPSADGYRLSISGRSTDPLLDNDISLFSC